MLRYVVVSVSEGYNLLAVYSKYIQLNGKSRLVPEADLEPRVETVYSVGVVNPPHRNVFCHPIEREPHCPTCTCVGNQNNHISTNNTEEPQNVEERMNPTESVSNNEENIPKSLNFKDEFVIFNHELLEVQNSSIFKQQHQCV